MSLLELFSTIEDPRRGQGLRTDLEQIFCMVVISYLCGHFGYRGVGRFCKLNSSLLIQELNLRHGVPSYVTFRDLLTRVDEGSLIQAFRKWSEEYVALEKGDWMSADGKALGSTSVHTQNKSQDFQSIVSLFCHKSGLVYSLDQYRRKEKQSGEAPLVRYLIEQVQQMGIVFTVDALNTQKNNSHHR